jgi:hypothetical protein
MDGWGASWISTTENDPESSASITRAQATAEDDLVFGDLGLDLIRVWAPSFGSNGVDSPGGPQVWNVSDGRLVAMRRVRSRFPKVRFVLTGAALPLALRAPGSDARAVTGRLRPGDEGQYGDYLVALLAVAQQQGTPFEFVSVGNEPDNCTCYFWAIMDAGQAGLVAERVAEAIRRNRWPTRIVVADTEGWGSFSAYANTALTQPSVRAVTGVLASHGYRDRSPATLAQGSALAARLRLPLWMTEFTIDDLSPHIRTTMEEAIEWSGPLYGDLHDAQVSAEMYLRAVADARDGANGGPIVRSSAGLARSKTFFLLKQYVRAAPRRAVRLEVTGGTDLAALAFRRSGRIAVVLTNTGTRRRHVGLDLGRRGGWLCLRRTAPRENFTLTLRRNYTAPRRSRRFTFPLALPAMSVSTYFTGSRC